MWNRSTSQRSRHGARRMALAGCILAMALSAPARGQVPGSSTTVLKTGLQLVSPRSLLVATVTELGEAQASADVVIEFHDASDVVVARTERTLTHREPVMLEFKRQGSGLIRLRTTVTITASEGVPTSPAAVLEEVDLDTWKAELRGAWAGKLPRGPDGAQTMCPGWTATWFSQE